MEIIYFFAFDIKLHKGKKDSTRDEDYILISKETYNHSNGAEFSSKLIPQTRIARDAFRRMVASVDTNSTLDRIDFFRPLRWFTSSAAPPIETRTNPRKTINTNQRSSPNTHPHSYKISASLKMIHNDSFPTDALQSSWFLAMKHIVCLILFI